MIFDNAVHCLSESERVPMYANNAPAATNFAILYRLPAEIFFQTRIAFKKLQYVFTFFLFYTQGKGVRRLEPSIFHFSKPYTHAQNLYPLPIENSFG